ncbi:hypothetical protein VPH35_036520 [Triticum aestivum]
MPPLQPLLTIHGHRKDRRRQSRAARACDELLDWSSPSVASAGGQLAPSQHSASPSHTTRVVAAFPILFPCFSIGPAVSCSAASSSATATTPSVPSLGPFPPAATFLTNDRRR